MAYKVIDVSAWQGNINWTKVKNSGVWGAILKAGGSDDGFYKDRYFEKNYSGCKSNSIHVGAYYFVGRGCKSYNDGVADAKRFLAFLSGKQFDLPVYIDFEAPNVTNKAGNTQACIGFCKTCEASGYYTGIYASDYSGFKDRLNKNNLTAYTWWVAHYGGQVTYATNCMQIWQYSSSGSVAGISGRVDMNQCYFNFPAVIPSGGYNGYAKGSTGNTTTNNNNTSQNNTVSTGNDRVRDAQKAANYYVNAGLTVDGIRGTLTNKAVIKCLQKSLNSDYRSGLAVDGIAGAKTMKAVGNHYVRKGERQWMVTFVEIALYALGYDPHGIEYPGSFGSGLETAVKKFQSDNGLTADGIVGYNTYRKLIGKF